MQIIAAGGGGFSMEDTLALDRYILQQARTKTPSICFLPTASGDSAAYVARFYQSFLELGAHPTVLSLFRLPTADLASYLAEQDVIYVGGGNTRSMLALWREWEVDRLLHEVGNSGTVLAGVSAGAACWFEESISDSVPGKLTRTVGLGLLKGAFCAHYEAEARRRPTVHKWVRNGRLADCWGVADGCAVHFQDGALLRVVQTRPNASAFRVTRMTHGEAEETRIESELLERLPRRYR